MFPYYSNAQQNYFSPYFGNAFVGRNLSNYENTKKVIEINLLAILYFRYFTYTSRSHIVGNKMGFDWKGFPISSVNYMDIGW